MIGGQGGGTTAPVASGAAGEGVVVTGAASQIGCFLIPRLAAAGYRVVAVSRRPQEKAVMSFGRCWSGAGAASWVQADLEQAAVGAWASGCGVWIHLGPLGLVPSRLSEVAASGVSRVIAFGSTSQFTKARSAHPKDRQVVAALAAGEADLARACDRLNIGWTLFRPTLIYGAGLDRNVMVLAAAIRRFGFFPLVGEGSGRRQPVHADDLAAACIAAIGAPASHGKAYDLSGGEVLSYRDMALRIFAALGRRPRFVPVPPAAVGMALWCLSRLPRYRDFNAEMARRMADDMVFPHTAAAQDFGYAPRGFEPVVNAPA